MPQNAKQGNAAPGKITISPNKTAIFYVLISCQKVNTLFFYAMTTKRPEKTAEKRQRRWYDIILQRNFEGRD